ncbi:MAG: GAF domain-containing protein [Bacteroidales bacterium]|nr:GAF domain-containing protein [Bacteroidales bacterium]
MNFIRFIYYNKLVNRLNKNLKIKQKTYLAFLLVSIMILLFSVYTLYSYSEIKKREICVETVSSVQRDYLELALLLEQRYSLTVKNNYEKLNDKNDQILISVNKLKKTINLIVNEEVYANLKLQQLLNIYTNIETSSLFENKNSYIAESEAKVAQNKIIIREIILDLQDFDKNVKIYVAMYSEQTEKQFKKKNILIYIFFASGIFASIIIANFISFRITEPIEKLKDNIKVLEQGDYSLDSKFEDLDNDEIGDIANGIERIGQTIKETVNFTEKIGRNEFDADLNVNKSGKLASALLSMRDNLKAITEQSELQKINEEKRNWVIKGLADLGNILRSNIDEIDNLYFDILKTIIQYIGANQGGFFIIQEKDNVEILKLSACYAYDRRKFLTKELEIGEGLVGQCALEKQITNLTEIPNNYIQISSGLGGSNPNNLILIPLILNNKVYGVLELASFELFNEHHIEYLEQSAESIASTISGMQINITTKSLLEKTQIQAEEISAREEEMRQNMEELEATQEESERKAEHYEQLLKESNIQKENTV